MDDDVTLAVTGKELPRRALPAVVLTFHVPTATVVGVAVEIGEGVAVGDGLGVLVDVVVAEAVAVAVVVVVAVFVGVAVAVGLDDPEPEVDQIAKSCAMYGPVYQLSGDHLNCTFVAPAGIGVKNGDWCSG